MFRYSNLVILSLFLLSLILSSNRLIPVSGESSAEPGNWPMWRYDAGRTAFSPHELPRDLSLHWILTLPEPKSAWPMQEEEGDKLAFDLSYEPIAYNGILYVPSMINDRLTAYALETGEELWRYYCNGPVRFAPVATNGKIFFISDDGYMYCLDAGTGQLRWKHRGLQVNRKILGNGRLIDCWPSRGGPVLKDNIIYYASGIWPFMGVFIYALDTETGKLIWENSTSGAAFINQIHSAAGYGGAAPQGYLAAEDNILLVPNGRTRPGGYKTDTGELLYLNFYPWPFGRGWPGQGGYSVMIKNGYFHLTGETSCLSDGTLKNQVRTPSLKVVQPGREEELSRWPLVDLAIANDEGILGFAANHLSAYAHQPQKKMQVSKPCARGRTAQHYPLQKLWSVPLDDEVEKIFIQSGNRFYGNDTDGRIVAIDPPGEKDVAEVNGIGYVEGEIWNMLSASNRLIVINKKGKVYCFGPGKREVIRHELQKIPFVPELNTEKKEFSFLLKSGIGKVISKGGYTVLSGTHNETLLDEILQQPEMKIILLDPDPERVDKLRKRLDNAGIYGERVSALNGNMESVNLPPYFANLMVLEDTEALGFQEGVDFIKKTFTSLRPYGGIACIIRETVKKEKISGWVEDAKLENAKLYHEGGLTFLIREGPLPGSGDWTHQNADIANTVVSRDVLVKAPLGLLCFGGPSNENALPRHGRGPVPQVSGGRLILLGPNTLGARDVYTGRLLWERSFPDIGLPFDNTDHQSGADHMGSPYVSLEDGIYVIYNHACLRLDPASGDIVSEFHLPSANSNENAAWGYIGVSEDFLIAGLDPHYFTDDVPGGKNWNVTSSGRIAVLNRHDGSLKWYRDAACGFRHNAIVAGKNILYVMDRLSDEALGMLLRRGKDIPEPKLMALDIFTGEVLWERKDNLFGSWLGYSSLHNILLQAGRPAIDRRDALPGETGNHITAYNGNDGSVIWDKDVEYKNPCILHDDKIIVFNNAFDIMTGEECMRENPITGDTTGFHFYASSNCGQMIGSTHLVTFRRGTGSYYDLTGDGGTFNIGGSKSGCTPNIIPANGILNIPDYTRTCICSYQMQTSLALVYMPELEYWTINQFDESHAPVKSAGINFGAPGDRRSTSGTMWLAYPKTGMLGGTSEDVPLFQAGQLGMIQKEQLPVTISPEHPEWTRFYKHSFLMPGVENNWIFASGLEGVKQITLKLIPAPGKTKMIYTVRLFFAEPHNVNAGERIFDVYAQDKKILNNFDVADQEKGSPGGVIKEFYNITVEEDLVITLTPSDKSKYPSIINGIEVLSQ